MGPVLEGSRPPVKYVSSLGVGGLLSLPASGGG
jgi:hypothetical protein